jgi:glycosyltransferase involved in cell wall biosynthesis
VKKVAIVVQRCHGTIVGGSEALAWQYASLLKSQYTVEILTSTALDYTDWANVLPVGTEHQEGVLIRRFAPERDRPPYWHQLYERLMNFWRAAQVQQELPKDWLPWSMAMQEEFIRWQGPFCPGMVDYLQAAHGDYAAFIFVTYLYPTVYFGMPQVPSAKVIFAPTCHDEPTAYLPVFRYLAAQAKQFIWLTSAEQKLTQQFWGDSEGTVVGMAIESQSAKPKSRPYPYLLYSGRIDENKGCQELIDFFLSYQQSVPSKLKLILTGQDNMGVPRHPSIEFLGFVSESEKLTLMAGAQVFMMPSPYESFSIVTLEAMAQGTPVLVNGKCDVLVEHVERSEAGLAYHDYHSFAKGLSSLLNQTTAERTAMAEAAQRYVAQNYTVEAVQRKLIQVVETVVENVVESAVKTIG